MNRHEKGMNGMWKEVEGQSADNVVCFLDLEDSVRNYQRTLNKLVKNNEIIKIGGGRYTSYIWNREND